MDPLAVSVIVIKSLSTLKCPLLSVSVPSVAGGRVSARDELLEAAFANHSEAVRRSIIRHVLSQMPDAQRGALQVRVFGGRGWLLWDGG